MDLTTMIKWASEYNTREAGVDPKNEMRATTYLGMIVDKGNKVIKNNEQTQGYMDDIEEYIGQLEKLDVRMRQDRPVDPDADTNPASPSPLLP